MALAAVIIAAVSARFAQKQADVAAEALDRATGKIVAKFEFAEFRPLPSDFRKDHLVSFPGDTDKVPYYPDANQLVLNPPVVWINNTGADTIDAVRVETTFLEGYIDSRGKPLDPKAPPKDWYKVDTPVILRRSEKDEHVLQRQLSPGMALGVPLLRGVLSHIAQAQSKSQTDSMHYARLKTAVYCRLTSSTAFTSDGGELTYMVNWMPAGFGADEVKRILDNYQPNPTIGPKVPVVLPKPWPGNVDGPMLFDNAINLSRQKWAAPDPPAGKR